MGPKEKIAPREKKVISIRRPGEKAENNNAEKTTEENKESNNKSDIKQNGDISDVVKEEAAASPVKEALPIKEVDSVEKNLEKLDINATPSEKPSKEITT